MHILLSPLFFCQRFCKTCARIFYSDHPDEWIWLHELEGMPPLGYFDASQGFIPDFSILMMFDEFIIPAQAYERIRNAPNDTWLGQWPEVIALLEAEGTLSAIDVQEEVGRVASIRGGMLRRDMRDPAKWGKAMTYFDTLMAAAHLALGRKPPGASTLRWEFDPERTPGVKGPDGHRHILSSIPLTDPGEDPEDPHYQLHELALDQLRSQLREVNAGLALASVLEAAPMFWAPYKGYLEAKSSQAAAAKRASEQASAAELFFRVAFPRYRPDTIRELGRLRRDRRLRQLRQVIESASLTGDVMDPEYPQRILEEVLNVERKIGRVRQIAGWISAAIGLALSPYLGLAAAAVSETATLGVDKAIRRKWNWFYLISDGTGHS
jgi:hypothetical protein